MFLVSYNPYYEAMKWFSRCHIQLLWVHECLDFYHTIPCKWGDVLSNALCILHIYNSVDVYAAQHHLVSCLLLSRIYALTMLWMILLCISFLTLIHDASPPVLSMDIFNSSTSKLVTSVEFFKDTIFINYYTIAWVLFIIQCC